MKRKIVPLIVLTVFLFLLAYLVGNIYMKKSTTIQLSEPSSRGTARSVNEKTIEVIPLLSSLSGRHRVTFTTDKVFMTFGYDDIKNQLYKTKGEILYEKKITITYLSDKLKSNIFPIETAFDRLAIDLEVDITRNIRYIIPMLMKKTIADLLEQGKVNIFLKGSGKELDSITMEKYKIITPGTGEAGRIFKTIEGMVFYEVVDLSYIV